MKLATLLAAVGLIGACAQPANQVTRPSAPVAATATPECPTLLQRAYFTEAGKALKSLGGGYTHLSAQAATIGVRPMALLEETWRLQTAVALVEIQTASKSHLALVAPPGTERIDAAVDDIATKSITITDLWVRGIDDLDSNAIEEAARLMTDTNAQFGPLTEQVSAFCDR